MNIRSALVAVPLIAIVSLVGCAQDASPGVSAARPLETRPAVDRQRYALVTDDISRAEYTAAFEAFASCMSEAGHPVYIHDRGVIVDYSYPYAGEVDGSFSRCYTTLFRDIDIAWQLAHEYESETIRKLIVCIAATGHRPAGDAEGVHRQVAELGIDPDACTRA